jgi:hypothetical protein
MDRRLECDHDFILTSGARFHYDPTNMCSGVVPITTGKSSEILWSWLVGSRREGSLRGFGYHVLGNITKGVTFLIHLWQNILKMYLGNITDTHYSVRLHWCLDNLGVFYIREYIFRVLFPECH